MISSLRGGSAGGRRSVSPQQSQHAGEVVGDRIRSSVQQPLSVRIAAGDGYREDAGGFGHEDVFRRVTDVGGVVRGDAEAGEAELQRIGMRLAALGVVAADDVVEVVSDA